MKILASLLSAAAALAFSQPVYAQEKPLEYQVIPTTVTSMAANVTLIKGDKSAVLVDAGFSRADAHRIVAEILDSGRTLQTIVITHDHPDHFFGLDVLSDAFPDAKIVADPKVAADMKRSVPIKFKRWGAMLGTNAPHRPVYPDGLPSDRIDLEGHVLRILGPMQGDHVDCTAIWDAESRTLITGDLAYDGVYVWLGEHKAANYAAWLASLDRLEALHPLVVIAGHRKPGLPDDSYALAWTRQYIELFAREAKTARTSQQLADALHRAYPDAIDVAGGFLVGVSSKVATGEIPPWDE